MNNNVKNVKCEIYHDHFQNYKIYGIPKAQLLISDIPYELGDSFFASRPDWWKNGDIKQGASAKAGKAAFNSDYSFNLAEFFHFCSKMLKKEPEKGESDAPCMIIFCSFEQIPEVISQGEKHGFKHYIPLVFVKNSSPQVLKANMKVVGATEYGLVLYRNKLPKFRNKDENGVKRMIKNWFEFKRDGKDIPRIHPTQKPVNLLKQLISIFTDPGDTVVDPTSGSGTSLFAARELGRNSYGFEISADFYRKAKEQMLGLSATTTAPDTASKPSTPDTTPDTLEAGAGNTEVKEMN